MLGFSSRIGFQDWMILVVYLLAVVSIGWWVRRRDESERGFVQGDRSLPFWAVGISMMATAVAADDFVGEPQFSFSSDCGLLGAFAIGYIGVMIVAFLFLPRFYRSQALTIYGYLGQRFSPSVQVAASAMSCLGNLFSAGVGLFIAAIAVASLLGNGSASYDELLPWVLTVLLVAGIVGTAYTTIGGIRSVVWTDVLQTVMIFVGGVYAIWFLCNQIPLNWQQMTQYWDGSTPVGDTPSSNKLQVFRTGGGIESPYSPVTIGLWILFFVGIFGTNHTYTQRLLACQSARKAGVGMLVGYSFGMLTAVMFLLIGLLIWLFAQPEVMGENVGVFESSEDVFPRLVVTHFPQGLLGLSLAAMMAAVMSSFDSATAAIASSFTADVIRPIRQRFSTQHSDQASTESETNDRRRTRRPPVLATICAGFILTLSGIVAAVTYDPEQKLLVDFALGFASFPIGGMLGVFCCALFTQRGNAKSAIAALVIGPLVWLFVQPDLLDSLTQPTLGISLTLPTLTENWFGQPVLFAWPWWLSIAALVSFLICCVGRKPIKDAPLPE